MDRFITNSGKILADTFGRFKIASKIPALELELNSNTFPPGYGVNGELRFKTKGNNIIYADFGDGTDIFTENFTGFFSFSKLAPYRYTSVGYRKVKVWFQYPELITSIYSNYGGWIGEFPETVGLYNLDDLTIRAQTRFETFPEKMSGGIFKLLHFDSITVNDLNYIPTWIFGSRITVLRLGAGFNLNNASTSGINRLIEIKGLESLNLWNNSMDVNSFPSNLKDIDTLRTIALGSNPVTEIPAEINSCKQIENLLIGYGDGWSLSGSSAFASWGIGVAGMENLRSFTCAYASNSPASLPAGLETAPNCKRIVQRSNFLSQQRIDAVVNNAFVRVSSAATKTEGDSLFRRITWDISWINAAAGAAKRPSGLYQQPTGYVKGNTNGQPASEMEMIWVLVHQYEWKVSVMNTAENGIQTYY